MNGAIEQLHQVILLQRLKDIKLATGEERTDDLKRRILCRRTN